MTYFWAKTSIEGKPGISVYQHMINVGCVARCIAEDSSPKVLERFQLQPFAVGALAALHDLGKITPGFQRKCEAWLEENDLVRIARNNCWDTSMESDHGKVSHAAIQAFLFDKGVSRKTSKVLSAVLGGHHGRLYPPNDRGYRPPGLISDSASKIDWHSERMTNAQAIWNYFGNEDGAFELNDDSPSLWWLAGLTSVADWIGSDERYFSPEGGIEGTDILSIARVFWFSVTWTFEPFVINHRKRRKADAQEATQLHPRREGLHPQTSPDRSRSGLRFGQKQGDAQKAPVKAGNESAVKSAVGNG